MPDTAQDTRHDDAGSSAVDLLVRPPQQARSRRTLRRILDASLDLLEREGQDALTVTTITKKARTSVGSFYARFEGKDDLLRYMGESALEDAVSEWARLKKEELPAKRKRRRMVRFLVSRLGRLYMRGPARAVVLLDGLEDPAPTRRERLEELLALDLRDLLDGPDLRTDLVARVLTGVLRDATLRHLRAGTDEPSTDPYPKPAVLLPELVELLVGYLGGKVRAPRSDSKVPEVSYAPYRPAGPVQPEPEAEDTEPAEPEPEGPESEGPATEGPATEERATVAEPEPEPEMEPAARTAELEPAWDDDPRVEREPPTPEDEEPGGIGEPDVIPDPWADPVQAAEEPDPAEPEPAPESTPEPESKPEPEPADEDPPARREADPFDVWG